MQPCALTRPAPPLSQNSEILLDEDAFVVSDDEAPLPPSPQNQVSGPQQPPGQAQRDTILRLDQVGLPPATTCPHCRSRTLKPILMKSGLYICDGQSCQKDLRRGDMRFHCPSRNEDCGKDYCVECVRTLTQPAQQGQAPTQPQPRYRHVKYHPGPSAIHNCYRAVPDCLHDLWAITLAHAGSLVLERLREGNVKELDHALLLLLDLPGNRLRRGLRGGKARTMRHLRARLSLPISDSWVSEDAEETSLALKTKMHRTVAFAQAGLFSKAAQSLYSNTRAVLYDKEDGPSVIQSLHPVETDVPKTKFDVADVQLDMDAVEKRCRRRGVAPGPTGWTWELFAPLYRVNADMCKAVLETLARRFLSSDCDTTLRERMTASRLLLIAKKNDPSGRPRPVAVGEFFLRCVAYACLPPDLPRHFEPLQIGIGSKGAVEKAAHWAREHVESRGHTLVTLDARNAFNTMLRSSMAAKLDDVCRDKRGWAAACALFNASYVRPSLLLTNDWGAFSSSRGSRQGCVFGGLLFAAVLQPILERLQSSYPKMHILAYLDDINVAFDPAEAAQFMSFFRELHDALTSVGLSLNLAKSMYYRKSGDRHALLDELGLQHEALSIRILGSFVGEGADVARRIQQKVEDHTDFFETLVAPELHSGVAFDLLRFSGVPRVCHLARTHPPASTRVAMRAFDAKVLRVMQALVPLSSETAQTEPTKVQLSLPMALGGFGLTRYEDLAELAYEASLDEFGPSPVPEPRDQKSRTRELMVERRNRLQQDSNPSDRARLLSCEGKGCWLHHSSHMPSSATWKLAAQMRLRAEVMGLDQICCRPCHKTIAPIAFGDHVMGCNSLGHYTAVHRHDLVTNTITEVLRDFGCVVSAASTGMHRNSAERADIIVTAPHLGGQICVDVSVTHPCAESLVAMAAAQAGSAAAKRERAKNEKHGEAARATYGKFSPWVFETFGRFGAAFERDISALELAVGPNRALSFRRSLRRRVALAIQIGNADMIANALRTATSAQQASNRPSCFLLPAARALVQPVRAPMPERVALSGDGVLLEPGVR